MSLQQRLPNCFSVEKNKQGIQQKNRKNEKIFKNPLQFEKKRGIIYLSL